jgi:hypothetical protein
MSYDAGGERATMNQSKLCAFLLALATCHGADTPPPPPVVTVEIISCGIAYGKADGTQWDGFGKTPTDLLALAGKADLQWPEFVASAYANTIEKPDPIGWADLDRGDGRGFLERAKLSRDDEEQEDTLVPVWDPTPAWRHVVLSDRVSLRLELSDVDDFNADDVIGRVFLTRADLASGLTDEGHVHPVRVKTQDNGQIAFVGIRVVRE